VASPGSQTTENASKRAQAPHQAQRPMTRWEKIQLTGALCMMVFFAFVNPITLDHFGWMKTRCSGVCDVDPASRRMPCGPTDTDRLVYIRIPKTGSSTVEAVINTFAKRKHFSKVYFDEDDGAVETLNSTLSGREPREGYIDSNPARAQAKRASLYRKVGSSILWPPWQGTRKTLFYGHIFRADWAAFAGLPDRRYVEWVPQWIWDVLHLQRASVKDLEDIKQFTVVRDPRRRLQSDYYYVRSYARNPDFRNDFVQMRGNSTFQECLLDPECAEKNEFRRWCSLQTQMICGLDEVCSRTLDEKALQYAKEQVEQSFALVGTLERLEDSLKLLENIFPTYFERLSENLDLLPMHKKHWNPRREKEFTPEAEAVLQDVCSVDLELYDFVDKLLSKRMEECFSNIKS